MSVSHERLKSVLSYNKKTGAFRWKKKTCFKVVVGKIAGSPHCEGYWSIGLDGQVYLAHRLAWFYVTGEWPVEVDHKNGKRCDNRWVNLRDAGGRSKNNYNQKISVRNSSGFKGVGKVGNRFRSRVVHNNKNIHMGYFDTPEEAHAAYLAGVERIAPGYARSN